MNVFMATHSYYETDRREKLQILASIHGVRLTLLIPSRWTHSLRKLIFKPTGGEVFRILFKKAILAGRNNLYFYPFLPLYLLSARPHIVHCEEEPFSLTTCQSIVLGRLAGARTLFFTWQNMPMDLPFPYNIFDAISRRLAHAAIAGNTEVRDVLQAKGFSKPIFVIPQLGISPDFGKGDSGSVIRARWNCRGFVVGFIGRVTRFKGVATLLRSVAMIDKETTALIIGRGEDVPSLQALAADLGIEDRVRFIDTVPHEEIAAHMEALDALVLPSLTGTDWKEQFGQVLIEAMSCGTPVVGSDSGAIPAVIGDAGLIFREGNAEELAARLQDLMKRDLRDNLRLRGLKRVATYFTHEKVAAATYDVYRFLLGGKPPKPSYY